MARVDQQPPRAVEPDGRFESRDRPIFENSFDGILITAPDGRVLAANPAACRLFGRTEQEICALGRTGLVAPDDARVHALLEERERSGRVIGALTFVRSDGSRFEAELSSALFDTPDGRRTIIVMRDISDRVRAEQELRWSEERFALAFRVSPAGMTLTRISDGTFLDANESFLHMFDYSRDEVIGHRSTDLGMLTLEGREELIRAQIEAGGLRDCELEARSKSGRTIHVLFSSRPMLLRGEPCHITTMIDITARKLGEKKLRESERMFASLFQTLPFAATLASAPMGTIVEVNQAFETTFGIPRGEAVGKTSLDLGLHVDPSVRERSADEARSHGVARSREMTLVTRTRGPRIFSVDTVVLDIGGVPHSIQTAQDITDRRRDEERLRESEARFRATFEQAAVGIAHVASDGRFLRVNDKLCQIVGYERDTLLNRDFQSLAHPEDCGADRGGMRQLPGGSEDSLPREERCLASDGRTIWVRLTTRLVRAPSGEPDYFVCVVEDITRRKREEVERAELEKQLVVTQKMEAIGSLAGGIAHDFNNILSVIINCADFVVDALPESNPERADVIEIQKAGERAAALTRQLLAFSRRQVMEPEVFDLNRVVTNIGEMLRRLLGEDIEVRLDLAADLARVRADPGQIEQVIMNLAVNARDSMPRGGVLRIETKNVDVSDLRDVAPGAYVGLFVTDTGTGMDPVTKSRIFEPFFTTKEKGKGTGLGLSTVYGIVKQSGAAIRVESEPGRGTKFAVYLPPIDAPLATRKRSPVAATGTETVLVVEDDDAVRKLVERILSRAGYRVVTAASASEALVGCEKHEGVLDLLLTDVVMPSVSGPELAVRLTERWPHLRVLYMSGYTDDAIVQHGVLAEGVRLVGKPFSVGELTRRVREVLDD